MIRRTLLALPIAVAAALLVALAGSSAAFAQDEPEVVAQVVALEGEAFVLRQGGQIPLQPGMEVADSDELLTFPQARIRLRFADGSLVTFGPNSRCLIAFHRRAADRQGDVLQLIEGILRVFTAEARADSLKVRTRSAIATPRGTEWIVERTPGATAVFVVDGIVSVGGVGAEEVLLTPGLGTDVPDGAPPGDPKRWGQARVDNALERTSLR